MSTTRLRLPADPVLNAIAGRSFCTVATVSPAHHPHVAAVLYEAVGTTLYVNTLRTSRKARNIAANPRVSVCIPVRRIPVGPPSSVQFQATAELLALDDPDVRSLLEAGHLRSLTRHGELEEPGSCFVRITPACRLNTYGLGMPLRRLLHDPLHAGGRVEVADGESRYDARSRLPGATAG